MSTSKDSQTEEVFAALMNVKLEDTRVYQEAVKEAARSLILKLLNRRLGSIPDTLLSQVQT